MEIIAIIALLCLCVSIALNVYFYHRSKQPKVSRQESIELREFLTDLLSGTGVIQVTRIAPVDVMIRSPRGRL